MCRHGRPAPVVFSTTEHPLTQAKALVAVSSAVADIMLRAPRRAAPAAPAPHSAAAAAGAAIAARPLRAELMQHARRIGEAVEKEEKLFNGLYTLVGSTTTPTAARRIPQPFLDELESLHELWEKITHRYADCYVLLESTKLATLTGRAQHIMRELIDVMEMVIETRRRAKGLFEYVTATGDNPGKLGCKRAWQQIGSFCWCLYSVRVCHAHGVHTIAATSGVSSPPVTGMAFITTRLSWNTPCYQRVSATLYSRADQLFTCHTVCDPPDWLWLQVLLTLSMQIFAAWFLAQ